jgi:hypothetical protein
MLLTSIAISLLHNDIKGQVKEKGYIRGRYTQMKITPITLSIIRAPSRLASTRTQLPSSSQTAHHQASSAPPPCVANASDYHP